MKIAIVTINRKKELRKKEFRKKENDKEMV
jgi:hypothetical protein